MKEYATACAVDDAVEAKVAAPAPLQFELHDMECAVDELHRLIDRLGERLAPVSTELCTTSDPQPERDAQGSGYATRAAFGSAHRTWQACRRIEALMWGLEV